MTALSAFDPEALAACSCYFAGGTAIALLVGEHRESVDIDFLCATRDGMRALRETVTSHSLGALLKPDIQLVLQREVLSDRYGVRTVVNVDGVNIKLELVHEDRIDVSGGAVASLPVPVLNRTDLYAEKLLANADRGTDGAILYRDMIDLAAMIATWGPIPDAAWQKARVAYGTHVDRAFATVRDTLRNHPAKWAEACQRMHIDTHWRERLAAAIGMA
ncbi:nucleotidyl transferase AbiEii/AbiGii toxin family protein [Rhodanobacter sp. DHB23]|uniref:nucleotidyl transferase AbiEii/AbiGii toxin family protein n=1 Tax=Rhodanobacter sp. DHB23 TaxID=2775923 RepID=UPI001786AC2E|nr:nucleotidyl transferase AbiEii/AbiGii toxin family protein [Rhodanobacter sp. DHB23]MBD8871924.1 nucleotidyl transferase AbiEii/AbiGii toxin family protein [Rhodanobacter sp. DHB23]